MGFKKGYLPCEIDEHGRMKPKYTYETIIPKIEEYFEETPPTRQTQAGLAMHLGISVNTLKHYKESEEPRMKDAIEWAYTRLQDPLEVDLRNAKNPGRSNICIKEHSGVERQPRCRGQGKRNIQHNK